MYVIITPDEEYGYPVLATEVVFTSYKRAENYVKKSGKFLDCIDLVTKKKKYIYYEIVKMKIY